MTCKTVFKVPNFVQTSHWSAKRLSVTVLQTCLVGSCSKLENHCPHFRLSLCALCFTLLLFFFSLSKSPGYNGWVGWLQCYDLDHHRCQSLSNTDHPLTMFLNCFSDTKLGKMTQNTSPLLARGKKKFNLHAERTQMIFFPSLRQSRLP